MYKLKPHKGTCVQSQVSFLLRAIYWDLSVSWTLWRSRCKSFRPPFSKGGADPTRGALVASAEAKPPFRRVLFCQAFFFAPLVSKKKAGERFKKCLWDKGNPPLVRFPSFRLRRKFTLRWRFGRIREFRTLRGATADRGGSDELLKKLEQNFQQDIAVTHR